MVNIDPNTIIETKRCPYCGWTNKPDYVGEHTVNFECSICGFQTSFIDPHSGFSESELRDYDSENDADFMDAVEEAEREDLESYGLEQHEPDENCMRGIKVLSVFRKINEETQHIFENILDQDEMPLFRVNESQSVVILIKKIFEEM